MDKIDFKKTMKELYRATKKVARVKPGEGSFLAVDGQGTPGGEAFEKAIQNLYPVAYTMKFALKKAGTIDFVVPPLEALWHDNPVEVPDMSQWRWRTMIRVPESVTTEHVQRGAGINLGEEGYRHLRCPIGKMGGRRKPPGFAHRTLRPSRSYLRTASEQCADGKPDSGVSGA